MLVHQLTALPDRLDFRNKSLYDATNRVRSEGTRILLDAARKAGARRMVAQSIAFIYEPRGDWVKDEDAPLMKDAPGPFSEAARVVSEMEQAVVGADGLDGLVLRYGFFYGPGTYYASDGSSRAGCAQAAAARSSARAREPSRFIHVDDAADATVAAVERGAPGIYNVVDDEPAPFSEWLPVYAEALGAKKPFRVPDVASQARGRQGGGSLHQRASRGLQRQGQGRARLGARPAELAAGLPRRLSCVALSAIGNEDGGRRRSGSPRSRSPCGSRARWPTTPDQEAEAQQHEEEVGSTSKSAALARARGSGR